jgi:hypothetical protein
MIDYLGDMGVYRDDYSLFDEDWYKVPHILDIPDQPLKHSTGDS